MADNIKNFCVLIPKTSTGENSKLYSDLLKRLKDRSLVNYFYAVALQPNVINHLTSRGFLLVNGEPKFEDFAKEFDIDKVLGAHNTQLFDAEKSVGARDNLHNNIEYDNALDAINKVIPFNNSNKFFVATVNRRGDKFIISVNPKNASNQIYKGEILLEKDLWNTISSVLGSSGINLEELHKEVPFLINPINAHQIPEILMHIKNAVALRHLNTSDIHMLLKLGEGSTQVNRLTTKSGLDLAGTANYIYNALQYPNTVTADTMTLIEATLDNLRQFNNIDLGALKSQVLSQSLYFQSTSEEYAIKDTIHTLRTSYAAINDEIIDLTNGIKEIRDVLGSALLTLQREYREVKHKDGVTDEAIDVDSIADSLGKSIENKQYYTGLLDFMLHAEDISKDIHNIISNLSTSGDIFTRCRDNAASILKVQEIIEPYLNILQSLTSIESNSILASSGLSDIEQEDVKEKASELYNVLVKFTGTNGILASEQKKIMYDMANEILGNAGMSQAAIDTLVNEEANKSSIFDRLYSIGRQSNALIGVMGTIIRDAQDNRDRLLNPLIKEIDSAQAKLEKETKSRSSEFMYDSSDNNRFLNPYNWRLYEAVKAQEERRLKLFEHLKGAELARRMKDWIDANTTNEVVDKTTGRTEKMPILSKYAKFRGDYASITQYYQQITRRKSKPSRTWIAEHLSDLESMGIIEIYNPVDSLSKEQKDYYDTMMDIKGRLGSMLPAYAQSHYLAPQVTKNLQDNIESGNTVKGVKEALKDTFTITDKDHELNRNYFMMGDEKLGVVEADYQGRARKYIPTYYTTPLRGEAANNLLKNSSSAMTHLAGVAVGFYCMSEVEGLCNVMGDYITGSGSFSKTINGSNKIDGAKTDKVVVLQSIKDKYNNLNTRRIVEGMLDQHLYGYTLEEGQTKVLKGWPAKLAKTLLNYSSIYNLTANVKGAVSNLLVGEYQMILDSVAGSLSGDADFYSLKDYIWAHDLLFKNRRTAKNALIEFLNNNIDSYNGLLAEVFDPTMDNYSEKSRKKYRSRVGKFIDKDWKFIGYGSGEHLIHYVNMLSMLHHTKIKVDGKETTAYDAFEIKEDANGVKYFEVKPNTTTLDGKPITDINDKFFINLRGRIREANQNMHGSMNVEDQGIIKQHLLGRAALHLRTWMIEHYARRYRLEHYSAADRAMREGFYITLGKYIRDVSKYSKKVGFWTAKSEVWNSLNAHKKTNITRAASEIIASLLGSVLACGGFLDPDDYEDGFSRFMLYQVKKLIQDVKVSVPVYIPGETGQIIKNIFPLYTTVHKTYYLIDGILNGDIFDEMKAGKDKGENRWWHNVKRRVIPFWHQIEELINIEDDDSIYNVFQMQYSM